MIHIGKDYCSDMILYFSVQTTIAGLIRAELVDANLHVLALKAFCSTAREKASFRQ
jgi:hypothetical protein